MDMRAMFPAPGNPGPRLRRGRRGALIALAAAGVLTLTIAHTLVYRAAERRLRQDLAAAGLVQAPLDIRHLGWSRSEVSLTLGGDARTEPVLILDRLLVDGGLADVLRPGGPEGVTPGHRDLTVLAATLTVPTAALSSRSGDGRFIWEAPLLRLNALPLGSLSFNDARVRVMAAPLLGRRFDLRLTGQLQHLDAAAGGGAPTLAGALAVSMPRDEGNDGSGEGAPPLVSAPPPDSVPTAGDLDLGTLEVRAEPGRLTLLLGGAGLTGRLMVREPGGGAAAAGAVVAGAEGGDSGTCALEAALDDIAAVRPVLAGVRLPHGALYVAWRREDTRTQTLSMEFTSRDTVPVAGGAPLALFQARLAGHGRVGRGWWGDASVDLRGPLRLAAADGGLPLSLGAGNARLSVREGDWVRPGLGELPPMTLRYDLGPVTVGPVTFTRLMAGDSRLSLGAEGGGWRWTLWPGRGALVEGTGWRVALPMEVEATGAAEAGTALSGWFGGDGVWRMDGRGPLSATGSVPVQPDGDPIALRLRADRFALRRDARGDLALSVTGLVPEPPVSGGIDAAGALPPLSLALAGHREDGGALTVAGTLGLPGSAPPMPVPLPPALTISGTLGADGRQATIDVAAPEAAMSGAGMGGRLGGRAHLRWMEVGPTGRSGWQGDAVVTARQVALSGGAGSGIGPDSDSDSGSGSGEGTGWSVDGLDGSLALASLFPLRTVSAQHLTAHRLVAGAMVIDDPALDVVAGEGRDAGAGAGTWRIIGGRGDWAGGELTVRPGGAGDALVLLEARGVRLSRLLPGLLAAGYGPDTVLAGGLRVDGGPDGAAIRDGMLAAPAGTVLRQDAGAPPAFDPRRNRDVVLLTAALRNMTFDRLAVRIDGPLGAPRLRLVGHGLNPDFYGGYPVDIDVDVSDLSGGGPVGASSGR